MMPSRERACASAANTSARPQPLCRYAGSTYMPKSVALWRAFSRDSKEMPATPARRSSANAPRTTSRGSDTTPRRDCHHSSGRLARSAWLEVNASGCSAYALSIRSRYAGASAGTRRRTFMFDIVDEHGASLGRRGNLESDDAGDDETETDEPARIGNFAEKHDAHDGRSHRADADPHRVRGSDRERFHGDAEQSEADDHRQNR